MKATMYLIQSKTGGKMWWSTEPRDNYDDYTFAEGVFELPEGYKMGEDCMGARIIMDNEDERCHIYTTDDELLEICSYPRFEIKKVTLAPVNIIKY